LFARLYAFSSVGWLTDIGSFGDVFLNNPFRQGRAKNRWSVWVSGNWRLTFEFKDGNAYVLDYENYH